ncbi:50S ribosomal protein L9 [bacterium B17]|nr:50S ribosomal protein L9 [bacterium B17]
MVTEVLLMTDVKDLGSEGEVVKVADGYARNYLLPKNMAEPVTEAASKRLAKLQEERAKERKLKLTDLKKQAEAISKLSITIPVKTGDGEQMYGSVGAAQVVEELAKQGVEVDRHVVQLEQGIKELGVFDVKIKLDAEIEAEVKVWVVEE